MKRILLFCCLCALLLAGFCTGCTYVKAAEDADQSRGEADQAVVREGAKNGNPSAILIPFGSNPVEKLVLSDGDRPFFSDLQIVKCDHGTFYGLGFGSNSSDCCRESIYRFDFSGSFTEDSSGISCTYSEAREFPAGSGIFYYFRADEASEGVRFMRLNCTAFREDLLHEDIGLAFDDIVSFCPGSQSAYYLDRRDSLIRQLRYSDGRILEIAKCPVGASLVDEILKSDEMLYVLLYDSCLKLDPATGNHETAVDGRILGSSEKEVYYLNSKNILCVYSTETGRSTETGVFSTLTRPYVMGRWTAFLSNPGNIVYIWDAEQEKIVMQAAHEKIKHLAGACSGRYFLYTDYANILGILDTKEQTDRLIDVSCFAEASGGSIDHWYFDGQYLYAQDISNQGAADATGDAFYRLDLSLLTPAAIEAESTI